MLPEFSGDFIQWLRGFYYTATSGSMTAAMTKMNRNQSAITYQIRSLEKEFGVKLFSGPKTNRVLTEEGKLLLSKVTVLFAQIEAMRGQLGNMPASVAGPLNVTCMFSFFNHILPDLVIRFGQQYPEVTFHLHAEMLESKMFEDISSNRFDIGVLASERIPDEFFSIPLFKTDLVIFGAPDAKIPAEDVLDLTDVARMPVISSAPHSSLMQNVLRQAQRYGVKMRPRHTISQQDCLVRCVKKGLGIGILDRFVVDEEALDGSLKVVSLSRFFRPRQYYMIMSREGAYVYPQVKAFLGFMRHEFEVTDEEQQAANFLEFAGPEDADGVARAALSGFSGRLGGASSRGAGASYSREGAEPPDLP